MAKGSAPVSRLSKDYNPNTLKKELDRINRAVNRISAQNEDIDNRISREILSVKKAVDVATQYAELKYWTEWEEEDVEGVLYAKAKLAFSQGWGAVADVQYRYGDYGNIVESEAWTGLYTPGTLLEWVEDTGTEEQTYPQGGYYRLRIALPKASARERRDSFQVQIRAVDQGNYVLAQESNTFDRGKAPDVMSLELRIGEETGSQYAVYAVGQCDLDTQSVGIGVRSSVGTVAATPANNTPTIQITFSTLSYDLYVDDILLIGAYSFVVTQDASAGSSVVVYADASAPSDAIDAGTPAYADWSLDEDNLTVDGGASVSDFRDYTQALTASNKNFDILIGTYDYGVPVYAIAAGYSELDNTGDSTPRLFQRASITTPKSSAFDAAEVPAGSITANLLAGSAQRATIAIEFSLSGTETTNEDFLDYSGTISWADGTSYSVSGTSFPTVEPPQGLWYIFHDPDTAADNNGTYNSVTNAQTQLQLTSSAADASSPTGRRIMVGVYRPGTGDGEAAFFVSNTTVSVTAPYISAATLSAISANLGTITTGEIAVTATVNWGAVSGTTDAPEDNATEGASWTGNLADIPGRFLYENDPDSAEPSGLYATSDYFGFWDQATATWKTYIQSNGNFGFAGDADNFFTWNGTNIAIRTEGTFRQTNPTTGQYAEIINGIYSCNDANGITYYAPSGISLYALNTGAPYAAYIGHRDSAWTDPAANIVLGGLSVGTAVKYSRDSITGASGGFDINPTGTLSLKGVAYPAYSAGYLYYDGSSLSWAAGTGGGGGGSTTFIGLTDTPANYTSAAGQYVRVNASGNALEFVTAPSGGGSTTFTGLTDTPANYTGAAGQYVRVNASGNALEFVTAPSGSGSTTFTGLTDTPANYTGAAGQYVRVNSGGTGLEFVTAPSGSGDVVGPSSAVSGNVASYDGTTGKLIQDSGIASANINLLDTTQTISGFKTHTNDITMRYASVAASPNTTVDSEPLNFSASFRALAGSDYSLTQSIYLNGTSGEGGTWVFRLGSTFSANDSGETSVGTVTSGTWSGTNISIAKGGTGASLSDPNADRILFWDDSASTVTWLGANNGLSFNGTNLELDWGSSVAGVAPYEVITRDSEQNIKVLGISGFGASLIDDASASAARTTLGLGSGITGSFTETEFRNQGGGTGTEFRSRTNTLTNGIVTAQGTWGAWTEVLAI